MAERPVPLPASEFSVKKPGVLAVDLLKRAGVNTFPVPTDFLVGVGTTFGLPPHMGQTSFSTDSTGAESDIIIPSSHVMRYQMAQALGGAVYEDKWDQITFARQLLAPRFLVMDIIPDGGFFGLGFYDVPTLSQAANIPSHVAIDRFRDFRNSGISHREIIVSLDQGAPNGGGYIWTARGTRFDSSEAREVEDQLAELHQELPRVLISRTEYNNEIGLYMVRSRGKVLIKRPNGSEENLYDLEIGKKVREMSATVLDEWKKRFSENAGTVLNTDAQSSHS